MCRNMRKHKEDDHMRTASEVVQHLNETRCNIYELSEQQGFGKSTLRAKLLKLGYKENLNGLWVYEGDALTEPVDVDVLSKKRMVVAKNATAHDFGDMVQPPPNIHQSLMQLDLNEKSVRTTISLRSNQIDSMKHLANSTRLRLNDVYSLAIAEFLERYTAYVKEEDKS